MTTYGSRGEASGLGRVFFVGAGPGAADLLTVRAIRVLGRADVVLHDALMTDEVLDWAPGAELIPVGKRCDGASAEQAWIDRALVDAARRHAVVVRLKGGDPTVFGRLDEEIDALDAAGVRWEIVPGITAASAAAAQAGHSLTRRGIARRVDIVTPRVGRGESGHGDGRDDGDWAEDLSPSGTVVLYMAGRIAGQCARTLLARGFPGGTPVVAVRAASWPGAATERTTLTALAAAGLPVDARPVVLLLGQALGSRPAAEVVRRRLAAVAVGQAPVAVDAPVPVPVA
ncbi:MAG: uroporphyrinogen-III C-methyltransferase [Burkholderiaceae bacterium]|nr:uroporphyrinogen-III C-methyltransferase [Burkholderiales bacterium]MCZ8103128.1 uroporphyrinogen-III C-methyltransferase [Burkholderiales bacterium]MCZ8337840.1 uroporphyrinogen-III C-methyltransferase [Burkholderiaceae bacterium]